jgi:hypothetical protein
LEGNNLYAYLASVGLYILDVSNIGKLIYLNCVANHLTSLDVLKDTEIDKIFTEFLFK